MEYIAAQKALVLFSGDPGSSSYTSSPLGTTGYTLYNDVCGVDASQSSVTLSGNSVTLSVPVTLAPANQTNYWVYTSITNLALASNGWVRFGSWLAPQAPLILVPGCTGITPALPGVQQAGTNTPTFTVNGISYASGVGIKYFSQLNPTRITTISAVQPFSGNSWQVTLDLTTLTDLGLYTIQPFVSNLYMTRTCPAAYVGKANYGAITEINPPLQCISASGNWTDNFGFNLNLAQGTMSNGAAQLTGTWVPPAADTTCQTTFNASGYWTPSGSASNALNLTMTNPNNPPGPGCDTQVVYQGTINSADGCSTGSGTFITNGNAIPSGNFTLSKACDLPNGETTAGSNQPAQSGTPGPGWQDAAGLNLTQAFIMTLSSGSGAGLSFGGRVVQEQDAGGGQDGCYFNGTALGATPINKIPSPAIWRVASDNTFGPDNIGYSPDLVAYLRNYRPSGSAWPCNVTLNQNMQINCAQGSYTTYLPQSTNPPPNNQPNILQVTIGQSSETVSREGATFTRNQ